MIIGSTGGYWQQPEDNRLFIPLKGAVKMADWSAGDWVFAYYSEDEYWYPAEIVDVEGGLLKGKKYRVRYDYDDEEEVVDADSLAEYSTYAGEPGAECWWEEDESYYAVEILDANEEEVQVRFEDGTEEWMDLADLRFEAQEE
jgi:hypothetical protein